MRRRTILAALGTAALFSATAPAAMAGKPDINTFPVDEVDTIDCGGFTLEDHVFGTIKSRFTENADGSARDIASIRLRHVITNPQTGESLTSNDVGVDKVTIHPDGSATVMQVGLIAGYRIPGEGLIAHESGISIRFFTGQTTTSPICSSRQARRTTSSRHSATRSRRSRRTASRRRASVAARRRDVQRRPCPSVIERLDEARFEAWRAAVRSLVLRRVAAVPGEGVAVSDGSFDRRSFLAGGAAGAGGLLAAPVARRVASAPAAAGAAEHPLVRQRGPAPFIGAYGDPVARTPTIDRLARGGDPLRDGLLRPRRCARRRASR